MKLQEISSIITTKNEEKNIKNCLLSGEQNKNIQKEGIVVDNYSTDKSIEIAKRFDCKILNCHFWNLFKVFYFGIT